MFKGKSFINMLTLYVKMRDEIFADDGKNEGIYDAQ
jgi:hypothetical protein